MAKRLKALFLVLFLASAANAGAIIVAAAANVQYAMKALTEAFEDETGIPVQTVVASSGKLTAQIEHGAPFDLFLSADMKYPERLYLCKKAVSRPKIYAFGSMVLWTLKPLELRKGLAVLTEGEVARVAIPNPKTAPYGRQAVSALKASGIYDRIKPKLIYGESVSQTNRYIVSKAVDAGITAKSVLFSPRMHEKGTFIEIDPTIYEKIAQGVVILEHGLRNHPESSRAFYDFLFSPLGRKILEKYGYSLP